jgi:hypothetical protein
MNNIQTKLSDAVYAVSEGTATYEEAYAMIVNAIIEQDIEYKNEGLVPTLDLLINDLQSDD